MARRRSDAFGAPIADDALYYVQNVRIGMASWALWWRPKSNGYTDDLEQAGQYLGSELPRFGDPAWPVEYVAGLAITRRLVPINGLDFLTIAGAASSTVPRTDQSGEHSKSTSPAPSGGDTRDVAGAFGQGVDPTDFPRIRTWVWECAPIGSEPGARVRWLGALGPAVYPQAAICSELRLRVVPTEFDPTNTDGDRDL